MRLGMCCCGGTAQCQACLYSQLPADWASRDYRLEIPKAKGTQYGRISSTPSGLFTGPCDGDMYWNRDPCGFAWGSDAKFPYSKFSNCAPGSWPFCAAVASFPIEQLGGFLTGNMVPQMLYPPYIADLIYENNDGYNGWSIRALIQRCQGDGFGLGSQNCNCENRTSALIFYQWIFTFSYSDGCAIRYAGGVIALRLWYLSDPFVISQGIADRLYLRKWDITGTTDAGVCPGDSLLRQCQDLCARGPCPFDSSGLFPPYCDIVRVQ